MENLTEPQPSYPLSKFNVDLTLSANLPSVLQNATDPVLPPRTCVPSRTEPNGGSGMPLSCHESSVLCHLGHLCSLFLLWPWHFWRTESPLPFETTFSVRCLNVPHGQAQDTQPQLEHDRASGLSLPGPDTCRPRCPIPPESRALTRSRWCLTFHYIIPSFQKWEEGCGETLWCSPSKFPPRFAIRWWFLPDPIFTWRWQNTVSSSRTITPTRWHGAFYCGESCPFFLIQQGTYLLITGTHSWLWCSNLHRDLR